MTKTKSDLKHIWRKRLKLREKGKKLYVEGEKLCMEGDKLWVKAILAIKGNIEWIRRDGYVDCKLLETGEIFSGEGKK